MSDSFFVSALNALLGAVLATSSVVSSSTPATGPARDLSRTQVHARPTAGRDVSWPNCPKGLGMRSRPTQGKPMPPAGTPFMVIGLTNGPAFHPNPCLVAQVDVARELHAWAAAYAVATYPTRTQLATYGAAGPHTHARRIGRLWNTGWAQAAQNVTVMREAGLPSPVVWVDVEPVSPPAPWSHDRRANRAVLEGVVASYRAAGLRVGFYSTPNMWAEIIGRTRYRLPEWRTAGLSTRRAALARCRGPRFQGGPAVLTQWYSAREDFDLLCPGRPRTAVLPRWFTRL